MGDSLNLNQSPNTWWEIHLNAMLYGCGILTLSVLIIISEHVPLWLSIPFLCLFCLAFGMYISLGSNAGQPMHISMLGRNKLYKLLGKGIDHEQGTDSMFIVLKDHEQKIFMVQYWRGDLKVDHYYRLNNNDEFVEHVVAVEFLS